MDPINPHSKYMPQEQVDSTSGKKTKSPELKTDGEECFTSLSHRGVQTTQRATFPFEKKLPTDTRYTYNKSGEILKICKPRVNGSIDKSISFKEHIFKLDRLDQDDIDQLSIIQDELSKWIANIEEKTPIGEMSKSTTSFLNKIFEYNNYAVTRNRAFSDAWKSKYLFCLTLEDEDNTTGLNARPVGVCYCVAYKNGRLDIDMSLTNPSFQKEARNKIDIRGTGRALKQSVINFVESSDGFQTASSYPINQVSAYLNFELGFIPA